jgi:prolyl-tRNA synthetase
MKLTKGFWQTLREDPNDAEISSHKLLMRAGLVLKTAAGIYSYMPFALRTLKKIENIVREELDKIDSQEIHMSIVTPGELWKESGRWDQMGGEMLRFKDKANRDLCISPTNEETITDIFRKVVTSYKQLPVSVYQINTKFRDEIRPRFGLMRGREFTMKDAYTFHQDKECLRSTYDEFFNAYTIIFKRMGFEFIVVEADGGNMAGKGDKTHEFQVVATAGEDHVVLAPDIGFAANIEKATTYRKDLSFAKAADLETIDTPDKQTIEDVCKFLGQPEHQSLKSLVYTATTDEISKDYLVLLLGDDTLNELKLKNHLGCDQLTASTEEKLKTLNLLKGYIGPKNIQTELEVIYDTAVDLEKSFTVGANETDKHFRGFVPSRDSSGYETTDLRLAREGDYVEGSANPVVFKRGIEVGHIFELGQKYTSSMNVTVLDNNGKKIHPYMGCYGLGITRTMQAAIEQNHDENGIVWPAGIAPFHVYFVAIAKSDETKELANELYSALKEEGIEVLYDDRKGGPGAKFKDADLLGLPIRVVLGERDYKESGEIEVKFRASGEVHKIQKDDLISFVKTELYKLMDEK